MSNKSELFDSQKDNGRWVVFEGLSASMRWKKFQVLISSQRQKSFIIVSAGSLKTVSCRDSLILKLMVLIC